jgi:spore coat protein A
LEKGAARLGSCPAAQENAAERTTRGRPSPPPSGIQVPEVYGDVVLVNGALFPYFEVEPKPYRFRIPERIPESAAVHIRTLTLNQYMHPNTHVMLMLLGGKYWHDPVTETPRLNTVEIWELVNLTQDLHPIHLHLVRFQLLDRRAFDVDDYLNYNKFHYIGEPAPPEPGETGWKDTIQAHPETVSRIIIPFKGYPGRFLWHCHLLEHAANEMMRPFEVLEPTHAG